MPYAAASCALHRARPAHGVRVALRPAAAGYRVDVHLWPPELGGGRHEEYVRHQREFAPASELDIKAIRARSNEC